MFEHDEDYGGFVVNCAEVVKSKECLAVTRLLAADLLKNPYLTVGDFLKNVSDTDLQTLVLASEPDENDEVQLDDIMLISMMLMQAEGLPPIQVDEEGQQIIQKMIMFLVCESLYRKGLVNIFRKNMSFGDEMNDKVIVEKK